MGAEILQYHTTFLNGKTRLQMNESLNFFFDNLRPEPRVLEIGTRRWGPNPTHHKELFPTARQYVMLDYTPGQDVDLVGDAHALSSLFNTKFDAVWSSATWEHLHSPWVAAEEVLKILNDGGVFFIST